MNGFPYRQKGIASTETHLVLAFLAFFAIVTFMVYPRVQAERHAIFQLEAIDVIQDQVGKSVPLFHLLYLHDREAVVAAGLLTEDQLSTGWSPIGWRSSTADGQVCQNQSECRFYTLEWSGMVERFCARFVPKVMPFATHIRIGPAEFPVESPSVDLSREQEKAIRRACAQDEPVIAVSFAHPELTR